MEIDFVTYGKPMKKRKGNNFASRILHIPDIEQQGKLYSRLREVTGDAILRVAPPEGLPEGSLLVVGSAPNFSPKFSIPQGCLTKNFSPIG